MFAGECDELKAQIAAVAEGNAFILQGGDCAETFEGVNAASIRGRLRVLLSMAVVMTYAAQVPGREDRPDRRSVRQAPQLGHGDP